MNPPDVTAGPTLKVVGNRIILMQNKNGPICQKKKKKWMTRMEIAEHSYKQLNSCFVAISSF